MRRLLLLAASLALVLSAPRAFATIFGQVHGVVHDPQHRPIAGARVELKAVQSSFARSVSTLDDGSFAMPSIPLGEYVVTVSAAGFNSASRSLRLASDTSTVLHFELAIASTAESVDVRGAAEPASVDTVTPTTLVSHEDILASPGADRTNSLAMITDYVPGAYVTHDQLHLRGGHQVSWQIDGVQIPNTNIASNVGAQIDPKDVSYLEVNRGSYNAGLGDRTYGVFNVVPRSGFERERDAELILSAGSFLQTNDQLNFGDHTQRFAYYASLSGSRSDLGLATPTSRVLHDQADSQGGFTSLTGNVTSRDQLRLAAQVRHDFFQIPYDPDPASYANQQYQSSGLRDAQHEVDSLAAFTWLHTVNAKTVLEVSPFFHNNHIQYASDPADQPVATTYKRGSTYAGVQASITTEIARNALQAGLYSWGQHDAYLFGSLFNDGSAPSFSTPDLTAGGLVEEYLTDTFHATPWLTLTAGLRASHFRGQANEDYVAPRVGAAVRLPRLGWVVRGFYGRFYQPPPLLTASGPVVQQAQANDTGFAPLHGERDEEHQFGISIPFRGWLLDADTFKTRANNFLDHSNLGESSLYFPVTIDGALIRAWELTLRSPRSARFGQAHLAYSNQIAEQRGALTGGLICAPAGSPQCTPDPGYKPLDHDQRNTLNAGLDLQLPGRVSASTNVYYGSGFTNGNPDPASGYTGSYLPAHTSVDLSASRQFGERTTVSFSALNVGNRRVLLDNSLTFGGFHYNDPREIYGEVRFHFHY